MQNPDIDVLISRVVDARAAAADWDAIERHAAEDAGVWKSLAMAQRDHALLSAAIGRAVAGSPRIELPRPESDSDSVGSLSFARAQVSHRAGRAAAWAGWAAAAAMALAFVGRQGLPASPGGSGPQTAGVGSGIANAADALSLYLDKGRADGSVIGEQPERQIVGYAPVKDGEGYEVFYLRQILERARVDHLYRYSSDELGRPAPVPVQPARKRPKPAV